jgi:hypothetical protein
MQEKLELKLKGNSFHALHHKFKASQLDVVIK